MRDLFFRVLGDLAVERAGEALQVGYRGQRALLGRLLLARGQVVAVEELIADLWPDRAPKHAQATIQVHVSRLRRILDRERGLLVTEPPGYALRPGPDAVDAWRFEVLLREGGAALRADDPALALDLLDRALGLWRGPVCAEFAGDRWALVERGRLQELRGAATLGRAAALLSLGRGPAAVEDLETHVVEHPLAEEGWRMLALARENGHAGPARALFPATVDLISAQSASLFEREAEARILHEAAVRQATVALVAGDQGTGKTTLAEQVASRLADRGWVVAWAHCQAEAGPWAQIADVLAIRTEPEPLRELAEVRPVLVVLDDLHAAGREALSKLVQLVDGTRGCPIMFLGAYRRSERSPAFDEALYRLAPGEPVRVELGDLGPAAVADLVRSLCPRPVSDETVALVRLLTAGNPFLVREMAHLLAQEGTAALESGVPPLVRDVLRRRFARLAGPVRAMLATAAVIGQELDVSVLVEASGSGWEDVFDAIEAGLEAGLVDEPEAGRIRFRHGLAHRVIYDDISKVRRARISRNVGVSRMLDGLGRADDRRHASDTGHRRPAAPR